MIIDQYASYRFPNAELLGDLLRREDDGGNLALRQLRENADVLWHSDHPHTRAVLELLAEAVVTFDKKLAKLLRKSAFKARSVNAR